MQYAIHESVMPEQLRARGAKVWVGDSILRAEVLRQQGLRAVSVLMWRDVFGEVAILFAMPTDSTVTRQEIRQCRQCALDWISQWQEESERLPTQRHQASKPKPRSRSTTNISRASGGPAGPAA